jgi:CheY-like chemotaxis protein
LRALQEQIELGYPRGISGKLDDIAAADPAHQEFVEVMRAWPNSSSLIPCRKSSAKPLPSTPMPLDPLNSDVVLIVDDIPENLSLLHDALDEAGYTVLVATNGESALQRARQSRPDVILLDAVMPGMDGFEVARRLKADHHPAHSHRLHDRPDRNRTRRRRLRRRRCRLRHQADPAAGSAGPHRRPHAERAPDETGAQRARRLRPGHHRNARRDGRCSGKRRWRGGC